MLSFFTVVPFELDIFSSILISIARHLVKNCAVSDYVQSCQFHMTDFVLMLCDACLLTDLRIMVYDSC